MLSTSHASYNKPNPNILCGSGKPKAAFIVFTDKQTGDQTRRPIDSRIIRAISCGMKTQPSPLELLVDLVNGGKLSCQWAGRAVSVRIV